MSGKNEMDIDPWQNVGAEEPAQANGNGRRPYRRGQAPVLPKYTLSWHEPAGLPMWPTILMAGNEYSGKSHEAALFTGDERVGQSWWLPIGEDAERWGRVPGANYRVVEHDGSWWQILAAVSAVADEARAAHARGDKPTVLVIDSMNKEWKFLSAWAEARARSSQRSLQILSQDMNADIDTGRMYWNDANKRHNDLLALLTSMPAIVVLTARGKMVSATKDNGQPDTEKPKEWTLDAQKELGFESCAYVKLDRAAPPRIIGVRLPVGGIRPGAKGSAGEPFVFDGVARHGRPALTDFSLGWLVFDLMKFDHTKAITRNAYEPRVDDMPDPVPAPPVPDGADEAPGKPDGADEIQPQKSDREPVPA